jgi:hypothetical protein
MITILFFGKYQLRLFPGPYILAFLYFLSSLSPAALKRETSFLFIYAFHLLLFHFDLSFCLFFDFKIFGLYIFIYVLARCNLVLLRFIINLLKFIFILFLAPYFIFD